MRCLESAKHNLAHRWDIPPFRKRKARACRISFSCMTWCELGVERPPAACDASRHALTSPPHHLSLPLLRTLFSRPLPQPFLSRRPFQTFSFLSRRQFQRAVPFRRESFEVVCENLGLRAAVIAVVQPALRCCSVPASALSLSTQRTCTQRTCTLRSPCTQETADSAQSAPGRSLVSRSCMPQFSELVTTVCDNV